MPPKKSAKGAKEAPTEKLFMIEFLVDKCLIFLRSLPKKLRTIPGDTMISFSIFGQKPIEISESDFLSCVTYAAPCEIKKNGKSALFALTPMDCKALKDDFTVTVNVYKKYFCPFLPDTMLIGFLNINLKKKFKELTKKLRKRNNKPSTVIQQMKEKLINGILEGSGCCIGHLDLIVRMSCFGKTIETGFTMNIPENSIFFKDRDGTSTFKYCKPIKCSTMPSSCFPQVNSCSRPCSVPDEDGDEITPAPCSQQCMFPPCTFPPCDIIIPPPLPWNEKLPKSIVTCGVKPTLLKPCDVTCGAYPCDYIPCEPIGCGGGPRCSAGGSVCETDYAVSCGARLCGGCSNCGQNPCPPMPCQPVNCPPVPCNIPCIPYGTCHSPCGYPCNWYPYGLPPCGTAPCGLLANGEPPCGASCSSPPYGVPPCRCSKPKPQGCGPPCTGPCSGCYGPCGQLPCFPSSCGSSPCFPSPCEIPCGTNSCGSSTPCFPSSQTCGIPCGSPTESVCGYPCSLPCGVMPCGFPPGCSILPCRNPPVFCDSNIIPIPCNPYPCGYSIEPIEGKGGDMKIPKPCKGKCGNSICKELHFCGYPCGMNLDMDTCMPSPEFVSCRPCKMVKMTRIQKKKETAKKMEQEDRKKRLMEGGLGGKGPKKKYKKKLY